MISRSATVCLMTIVLLPAASAAQQGSGNNPATTIHPSVTPKKNNNRFAIAYASTTGNRNAIGEAVVKDLVQRLSQNGFVRAQPLDVQCCNLQVEVLDAASPAGRFSISVRITVQDVDKQFIYGKQYRGEAPSGPGQVAAAAAEVAKAAMADNALLKALTHD